MSDTNALDLDSSSDFESIAATTALIAGDFYRLADATGKNDKRREMETLHPLTKRLFILCFDPFKKFGVSELAKTSSGQGLEWDTIMRLLDEGKGRELKLIAGKMTQTQLDIVNGVFNWFQRWKLGIKAGGFLAVYPGAYRTFELQLSATINNQADYDKITGSDSIPKYIQRKLDGVRAIVINEHDGTQHVLSRNGKPVLNVDETQLKLLNIPGLCFDTEAAAPTFEGSLSLHKRKSDNGGRLRLHVFDMIRYDDLITKNCVTQYFTRYRDLVQTAVTHGFTDSVEEHFPIESYEQACSYYAQFREEGFEGAIVKLGLGTYDFDRTNSWSKMKPEVTGDFKIVGYKPGTVGSKNEGKLGAFIVADENGVETSVGGGITDENRAYYMSIIDELIASETLAEVEYMEKTPSGKLRHPRFKKLRTDKDEVNS